MSIDSYIVVYNFSLKLLIRYCDYSRRPYCNLDCNIVIVS